ncbi:MAG TPA: DUF2059 domain-containing protein [Allosphingosinicella sp.]|jgi:hypothetical protein|nr:DUF2059 domain-containing protein [Allosphingosinicella sp.]
MRVLLAAMALAGAAAPCAARQPAEAAAAELDPRRLELAGRIVDIAFPPERRRELLLGAVDAMTAQLRAAAANSGRTPDPGVDRIVERYMKRSRAVGEKAIGEHVDSLFGSYARGYARAFTADELAAILAFVRTPAGAKYVRRSPELLSDPDVARANSAYLATVMAAVQPLQAELRRELTEYFAKSRP